MLRVTKLHTLLSSATSWNESLRLQAVSYLHTQCTLIDVLQFADITGHDELTHGLVYAKRDKLARLTELATPQEVLTAWDEVRRRRAAAARHGTTLDASR